jgi:hypothetical protein
MELHSTAVNKNFNVKFQQAVIAGLARRLGADLFAC